MSPRIAGKICFLASYVTSPNKAVNKDATMSETKLCANPKVALLILGVIVVVMASSEIYGRSSIELEGLIVSREVVCQQPKNNRCVTNYQLKSVADNTQLAYAAGPTDQSLSSELRKVCTTRSASI